MTSLTQRALTALLWNMTGTLGNQVVQFAVTIALARLLSPEQFGLVAMLSVFLFLAQTLIDSGYGSALIQKQAATRVHESSVFYLNLALSAVLYVAFWFLMPFIAAYYRRAELVPLGRALALAFPFSALGLVQICLCAKRLDFRTQTRATMVATIVAGTAAIVLAWRGFGAWSLVAQLIGVPLFRSVVLWITSPWRPIAAFSIPALRELFGYGSRLLVAGLLSQAFDGLLPLVIGRMHGAAQAGLYARAQGTQRLAAGSLTTIVVDVAFPVYAAVQHDRAAMRHGYRQSIIHTSAVIFPLMFGLAAVAHPLFRVLFGEPWLPSVPYFQVLCLSGALYHIHALNLNVLKATGRSDLYLGLAVLKMTAAVAVVLISAPFGVAGLVLGQAAISVLALGANTWYGKRLIDYGMRDQCVDLWRILAISLGAAGVVAASAHALPPLPAPAALVGLVGLHVGLYLVGARVLRVRGPIEVLRHLRAHAGRLAQPVDSDAPARPASPAP
jgi:O-antigen/teichoic acid export membrane protein